MQMRRLRGHGDDKHDGGRICEGVQEYIQNLCVRGWRVEV